MRDPGQPKVCNPHIVVLVYQEIPCTGKQPSLPSLYASFIAVQGVTICAKIHAWPLKHSPGGCIGWEKS